MLGGLEIATMAGAVLQAAAERRVIVVDGFITTAAVAVAAALAPAVLQRCVFAHASAESGHARWLAHLGVRPLLDLGLRLGEGSGRRAGLRAAAGIGLPGAVGNGQLRVGRRQSARAVTPMSAGAAP